MLDVMLYQVLHRLELCSFNYCICIVDSAFRCILLGEGIAQEDIKAHLGFIPGRCTLPCAEQEDERRKKILLTIAEQKITGLFRICHIAHESHYWGLKVHLLNLVIHLSNEKPST